MRWIDFARAHGGDAVAGLPGAALRRIAEALDAGRDVVDVARQEAERPDGLPPAVLSRLWELEKRRVRWVAAAKRVAEARIADGLAPLPEALVREMRTVDAIDALDRATRLAPSATAIELREYVAIWDACVSLARRDGTIRVAAATEDQARLAPYEDHAGTASAPGTISPHRWLAVRRGEREGAVALRLDLPVAEMRERLGASLPKLDRDASRRPLDELLEGLVLGHLERALRSDLDARSESEALGAAAGAYAALFRIPPVAAERLGGVYLGRGPRPVTWVVADGKGGFLEAGTDAGVAPAWAAGVVERIKTGGGTVLVLPASSPAVERLRELERAAEGRVAVSRIPTAALREAKAGLTGEDALRPSGQAAALVLIRRALDPAGSFGAVDPASLGLAEYQHDIDPESVSRYLRTARALAEIEAARAAAQRRAATAAPAAASGPPAEAATGPGAALGAAGLTLPLLTLGAVSSIEDLRPGMILAGTVTTIASFGAFVNIGLRQEGLVHVSEMADHRVEDATQVVRPGQQVRVRVVDVDRVRNRVSLSLRLQDTRPARAPGGSTGRARAAALRELDKYFKK